MPDEPKLTGIEVAKVLTGVAHQALVDYEEDNKIDMSEVLALVEQAIKEMLAEAND